MDRRLIWVLPIALVGSCTNKPEVVPPPVAAETTAEAPRAPNAKVISLANGYEMTAVLERRDSVILSLPDGRSQIQQMGRYLRFHVSIDGSWRVRVRLDSMSVFPAGRNPVKAPTGHQWQGRLTRDGLVDLDSGGNDPLIGDLTNEVRDLFPVMPRGGVAAGDSWTDTTQTERQVEIFKSTGQRRSLWRVGEPRQRMGIEVLPVSVTENYEQRGKGIQTGREMMMSAQGSRSAIYYLTLDGRLDGMEQRDVADRLITIPSTRQAIPTKQVIRTVVTYRP